MKKEITQDAVNHAAAIVTFVIRDKNRAKSIYTQIVSNEYETIDDVMLKIRTLVGDMPMMGKYINDAERALQLHQTLA